MDSDIMTWLSSGRNHQKGIEILQARGASSTLIRILSHSVSDFTSKKLYEEIMKLEKPEPVKTQENPVISKPAEKPEYLIFQEKHKGDLYALMSTLHGKMKIAKTPKTRRKFAGEILELEQQINAIWKELDYWRDNGVLMPVERPNNNMTNLEMAKRITNLENYIRRDKAKRNNKAVAKWIQEKESLEQILAGSR